MDFQIGGPERDSSEPVVMKALPANVTTMDKRPTIKGSTAVDGCSRLPIPEGRLISEYVNGQSGDQLPQQEEVAALYSVGAAPGRG